MLLRDILKAKGSKVLTVSVHANLDEVVQQLVRHNVGSLVVCDGEQIVGIITERDILRAVRDPSPLAKIAAKTRMTAKVISGSLTTKSAKSWA